MKIVLVNGSPRKGNNYHAAKLFLDELSKLDKVNCTEYFLPQDLPMFCLGCGNCFNKGEEKCPHAKYTIPILTSMLEADALVFTSPVFVWEMTGAMKNFFDHFAHLFLVHRPRGEMFYKKAFIISTSNGGLKNAAIKPIKSILKQWGINRIYSLGFVLHQMVNPSWEKTTEKRKLKFEQAIKRKAKKFYLAVKDKKHLPYFLTQIMFQIGRNMIKKNPDRFYDAAYWKEKGWMKNNPL